MIWTIAGAIAILAAVLAVGLYAWGALLPQVHTAVAGVVILAPPEQVFERIADVPSHPKWRKGVKAVEVLGDGRWVEKGPHGRIPYQLVESVAPTRLVTRIDTTKLPFEGTWTFTVRPTSDGTEVDIREDGRVKSPMFRAMGRMFFPQDKTMKIYLADLERSFT